MVHIISPEVKPKPKGPNNAQVLSIETQIHAYDFPKTDTITLIQIYLYIYGPKVGMIYILGSLGYRVMQVKLHATLMNTKSEAQESGVLSFP